MDNGYAKAKREMVWWWSRWWLTALMKRNGQNRSAAAREIGMERSNLLRLLREHGLSQGGAHDEAQDCTVPSDKRR